MPLLSHHIQAALSPSRLPAALRALRGLVFPHNAPGPSSLSPPSSEAELAALGGRAARALLGLVPKRLRRLYLGAGDEEQGAELERLVAVLGDAYCNKHLAYALLELLLVRLMPELADKGVVDLWDERLG
ncbi:hypothetical protein CDD83_4382 [Cordyceps sp. RAO-2017]|nr:hypothetical protein CDD83_4382 [Cordyceps sp. RAO-2017]